MGFAARPESAELLGGGKYGGLATDMTIVHFAKADVHGKFEMGKEFKNTAGMIPRKIWVFKDCVPIKVDSQDMTYGIDNDLQTRGVEWQYRKYQVFFPEANQLRMGVYDFFKALHEKPAKNIRKENDDTSARYKTRWGPASRPSKQIVDDVHKKGAKDPQQHQTGGSFKTYYPGAQYLSDAGKAANYSTHQNHYNAIEMENTSLGASDITNPYETGKSSWGDKGTQFNGTDGVNLATALRGKSFPEHPPGKFQGSPRMGGNDPRETTPIKEATETEIGDAYLQGAVDPSTGENEDTNLVQNLNGADARISGPIESRRLIADMNEQESLEDATADWGGGGAVVEGNALHDAVHGFGKIGMWGSSKAITPGTGTSNMQNIKKAQKIKGSSGIFGLLGF
jgi:hypothetical protein